VTDPAAAPPPDAPGPSGAQPSSEAGLYDPAYVRALFDEMSSSYERVNTLTSFGFSRRWRRQVVERLAPEPGAVVLDAMTGMGEGWRYLLPRIGSGGRIVALDASAGMLRGARRERDRLGAAAIEIVLGDALVTGLAAGSVDAVLCLFGLKTLSPDQQAWFAGEIARVLRPGGRLALVEVSTPPARALRAAYLLYLKQVIPALGRILLGNPDNYRMLGRYTERFGDAGRLVPVFAAAGLDVAGLSLFFGCATGIVGRKPGP
jgi:demethylmenaquinone methyltransferase/2-methoxy-6-polyprenyl-1,4-benzoquinol methylase